MEANMILPSDICIKGGLNGGVPGGEAGDDGGDHDKGDEEQGEGGDQLGASPLLPCKLQLATQSEQFSFTCNTATSHSTPPILRNPLTTLVLLAAAGEWVVRVVAGGTRVRLDTCVEADLSPAAGLHLRLAAAQHRHQPLLRSFPASPLPSLSLLPEDQEFWKKIFL